MIESDPLATTPVSCTVAGQSIGGDFKISKSDERRPLDRRREPEARLTDGTTTTSRHYRLGRDPRHCRRRRGVVHGDHRRDANSGISATAAHLDLEINTASAHVSRSFTVGTGAVRSRCIDVPAGPFVRVELVGARSSSRAASGGSGSDFYFDQSLRNGFSGIDTTAFSASQAATASRSATSTRTGRSTR